MTDIEQHDSVQVFVGVDVLVAYLPGLAMRRIADLHAAPGATTDGSARSATIKPSSRSLGGAVTSCSPCSVTGLSTARRNRKLIDKYIGAPPSRVARPPQPRT
jgi:hypothetical protein